MLGMLGLGFNMGDLGGSGVHAVAWLHYISDHKKLLLVLSAKNCSDNLVVHSCAHLSDHQV